MTDNQQATLTEADIGWLAGIIEGEGSLAMNAYDRKDRGANLKVQTSIMVYNTDARIIEKVTRIMDQLDIGYYIKERVQKAMLHEGGVYLPTASMLCMLIKGLEDGLKILRLIRPHMVGEKAARADIMIRYLDRRFQKIQANNGNHRNLKMDREDFQAVADFYAITKRSNPNTVKRVLNELERCAQ